MSSGYIAHCQLQLLLLQPCAAESACLQVSHKQYSVTLLAEPDSCSLRIGLVGHRAQTALPIGLQMATEVP